MANDTAKILVQKRASRCRWSRPVMRQRTSSVAMNAASPMVKLGKMMWKEIVKANWMRASRTASRSMAPASLLLVSTRARIVARFGDGVETGALRRAVPRDKLCAA